MNAGWMFLRTGLRRRWRSWLALALIVGAFAGAVEAAAAGARRTDAAYPARLAWSNAPDLLAASGPNRSVFGNIPQSALARLPQTTRDAPVAEYSVVQPSDIALLAPESRAVPGAFWRRKILAGRLPDPRRAGEVNVSFTLAQARHLRVGSVLRVNVLTPGATPRPVPFTFRVVGIDAAPGEFPPQAGTGTDFVWATPAFYARHHSGLEIYPGVALRLRRGAADLPAVLREISQLALVTIVHLLLTAVRRRRRDFAVLRVIGLTRGQVRATVGWQAASLACAALAIGVPAGVLLGRAAWRVFAGQLGIVPVVAVPWAALTAMAAIALAVAVAAAALPGESAARSAPATILRSE